MNNTTLDYLIAESFGQDSVFIRLEDSDDVVIRKDFRIKSKDIKNEPFILQETFRKALRTIPLWNHVTSDENRIGIDVLSVL